MDFFIKSYTDDLNLFKECPFLKKFALPFDYPTNDPDFTDTARYKRMVMTNNPKLNKYGFETAGVAITDMNMLYNDVLKKFKTIPSICIEFSTGRIELLGDENSVNDYTNETDRWVIEFMDSGADIEHCCPYLKKFQVSNTVGQFNWKDLDPNFAVDDPENEDADPGHVAAINFTSMNQIYALWKKMKSQNNHKPVFDINFNEKYILVSYDTMLSMQ